VSAAEDCVVLRIPGRDFLAGVSGALPVSLQTEIATRLDRGGGADDWDRGAERP
jgi:hypothetical protein